MVRQARSEATRRRIIDAAVDLFNETGYAAINLGDIIERAEMTKGAFYYHFDSKESLATAIIEEAGVRILEVFQSISPSSSPAFENVIHGMFVITDFVNTDRVARTGAQLMRAFGEFSTAAGCAYGRWLDEATDLVRQADAEGDLRADVDPRGVAETIVGAMLGTGLLANAISAGADLRRRVRQTWSVLLPAVVNDDSLHYFREFVARESLRQTPPAV